MSEEIRRGGGGMQFTGTPPPQFHQALRSAREEAKVAGQKDPFGDVEAVAEEAPKQTPKTPKKEQPIKRSQARVAGSSQLEDAMAKLREANYNYDEIVLPSMGVFYNGDDGPIDGVLHIRPMTGEEEQILATNRYTKKGIAVNLIFQRCIKETIRPDDLLSVDRNYILIYLRGISYGADYEVDIKCPDCGKSFTYTVKLSELPTTHCPEDFRPPLTDVLPKSQLTFTWKLPRGRDENLVNSYREKRAKEYGDAAIDDSLLYRMTLMLEEIHGVTSKTELLTLLKKLQTQDIAYLRGLALNPPFGVDTEIPVSCLYCYHDFTVELPFESGFFFPKENPKKEKTNSDSGDI